MQPVERRTDKIERGGAESEMTRPEAGAQTAGAEESGLWDAITKLMVICDGRSDNNLTEAPDVRSLKGELLANGKKAAGAAWSAFQNGVTDERAAAGLEQIIRAVCGFCTKDELKPALRASELLLKSCRELQTAGEEKKNMSAA